tara:strand:+ start:50 stop:1042 length:993 start_codon:yes stop_codon:yes gene_type:complete
MLFDYIWLDSQGGLRSKIKVLDNFDLKLESLPLWNYDGSSTGQADGQYSEVILKPCAFFKSPFQTDYLVLCETMNKLLKPHSDNTRSNAVQIFKKHNEEKPMFGIEQEFFLKNSYGRILGFERGEHLKPQGDYYCGIGADNAFGRVFVEKAFENCLTAGLKMTGMNAEVAPGQWEFQVCDYGINAADQLYVMRYILSRTLEYYGICVDFHPKPIDSPDWNGSGCHTNFSTESMRNDVKGLDIIYEAIEKLEKKHDLCMQKYGKDNDKRMTGKLETSDFNKFSYGVANRTTSIRIPSEVYTRNRGYFEDRRPSSNMDPYVVTSLLVDITCS